MPRLNYGPEVKKRAKRLFEALLLYVNHELDGCDALQIQTHWSSDKRLIVQTKLRYLEALTTLDPHYGKLDGSEIKEAFARLKDLELLEDNRVIKQGSESWHFTLNLWYSSREIASNLRRLDELWEQRKQQRTPRPLERSPDLDPSNAVVSHQDWGEAIHVAAIYGRTQELATLENWVVHDRCRLVTILGMGGQGKTTIAIKFAEQIQDQFERVIWRSLRNAPPLTDLLPEIVRFIARQPNLILPEQAEVQIATLLKYLQQSRCLIVLDNVESIFQSGQVSSYLPGYESYGLLFKMTGEANHQSCLLLTSREKPSQVAWLEGDNTPVRSLLLTGLTQEDGQSIFTAKGCFGATEAEWEEIFSHYSGNPLALQIVAAGLQEVAGGDISELLPLLRQGRLDFHDINDLLVRQFARLSEIEQQVLYWLAINREPLSLAELVEDVVSESNKRQLSAAIQSLNRRCMLERSGKLFSLQPVVTEYVTGKLIWGAIDEFSRQQYNLLRDYALVKAQSKDYIRQTQIRLIFRPLIDGLLTVFDNSENLIRHLKKSLALFQQQRPQKIGYVAGNFLNILIYLMADLSELDCSNLAIWQASLVGVPLNQVNFSNTDLSKSVFTESLGIILSMSFNWAVQSS
jgi:hypothetical protein